MNTAEPVSEKKIHDALRRNARPRDADIVVVLHKGVPDTVLEHLRGLNVRVVRAELPGSAVAVDVESRPAQRLGLAGVSDVVRPATLEAVKPPKSGARPCTGQPWHKQFKPDFPKSKRR